MAMSKKDFVELAEQFKFALRVYEQGTDERRAAVKMIEAAMTACRRINDRFDGGRFFAACGVTDEDLRS